MKSLLVSRKAFGLEVKKENLMLIIWRTDFAPWPWEFPSAGVGFGVDMCDGLQGKAWVESWGFQTVVVREGLPSSDVPWISKLTIGKAVKNFRVLMECKVGVP